MRNKMLKPSDILKVETSDGRMLTEEAEIKEFLDDKYDKNE